MLLGILLITIGNVFVWQAEEQTTQFFTGWIFGAIILSGSGAAPKPLNAVLAGVSTFFLIDNEQIITTKPKVLNCKNGVQKIIGGAYRCVCTPPYIGELCDQCPPGAITFGENQDICNTCKHMYMFPFCTDLQPGYKTTDKCNDNWIASCINDQMDLTSNDKTYGTVEGLRNEMYNVDEDPCKQNGGTVYCDKCKAGFAGPFCCPDGKYGPGCSQDVPMCTEKLDYGATLAGNEIPEDYGLVDPDICYTLGDDECSCGGEFIGDNLCASNMCVSRDLDGDNIIDSAKCTDLGRVPEYDFRCDCDVGVGPDCETPTCYGGTRMWAGKGICRCNAQHMDSYKGITFDACNIQADGECYPGLFGEKCEECQCVVDIIQPFNTTQCKKNMYGVFDRDFRTKEYTRGRDQECIDSGICTNSPDDCGVVEDGADRCLLFTNPETFSAILFSGDNCTDTTDSKCRSWEPCKPR